LPETGTFTPQSTCEPVTEDFKEVDLIGTWQAVYGAGSRVDTLIIEENGKYKQSFSDSSSGYTYVSDWNPWWLESRPSGFMYLHMKNMMFCDLNDVCVKPEDELGNFSFFDICENRSIDTEGEMILVIVGDKSYPGLTESASGIALLHLRPPGREGPPFRFTPASVNSN
jgi:hypothetical protein